jgi:hypothetical protein
MIRWLVAIVGAPVVLGLIAVSVILNFRFGTLLATDEADKLVYGLASGCADLLKGVLPFVIAWGWGSRKWLVAFVASLLFITFTAYSVTSALGFAALNRDGTSGKRQAVIERQQHQRSELARKQRERAALPTTRPVATIDGELAAARQNARWDATAAAPRRRCRKAAHSVMGITGSLPNAAMRSRRRSSIPISRD